jgi:cysteine desulfurase family protein (TIGR01976 family)
MTSAPTAATQRPVQPQFPVEKCRSQFPSLNRKIDGTPAIYLDGPAGTQVPQSVADAIRQTILHHNANTHGHFVTSDESQAVVDAALTAAADFVGASDPHEIVYGQNMTTLTFQFSRALAQTWKPGDNIVVTRLDHDANFSPWKLAANDAGIELRIVDVEPNDATLCLDKITAVIDGKTRLVAVTCASNAVGSRTPVKQIAEAAHASGALVYLDAVHYAPHDLIDVADWNCDFLTCSTYKFFGPHIGLVWARRELLESLSPYKVRPATEEIPYRWMTGTANFACLAGATAAIDYMADIAPGSATTRRDKLRNSFGAIVAYESHLATAMIKGLNAIDGGSVHGISDPARIADRVPTIGFTKTGTTSHAMAERLGNQQIFAWSGHYYAIELIEQLGLEPNGMLRLGLMHYNTIDEVKRTLEVLA